MLRYTPFQNAQARRIVRLHDELMAASRAIADELREAQRQLQTHRAALVEIGNERKGLTGRMYSSEERALILEKLAERERSCAAAIGESEEIIADINARRAETDRHANPAAQLADAVLKFTKDPTLRKQLGGTGSGAVDMGPRVTTNPVSRGAGA